MRRSFAGDSRVGSRAESTLLTKPQAATAAQGQQGFGAFGFIDRLFGPAKKPQSPVENVPQQVKIRYPVNLSPAGEQEPNIEWGSATSTAEDGSSKTEELATVIGRFYLWQKQDQQGRLLEMQADNAVVFYAGEKTSDGRRIGRGKKHRDKRGNKSDLRPRRRRYDRGVAHDTG